MACLEHCTRKRLQLRQVVRVHSPLLSSRLLVLVLLLLLQPL